jgi:hypothetical protein
MSPFEVGRSTTALSQAHLRPGLPSLNRLCQLEPYPFDEFLPILRVSQGLRGKLSGAKEQIRAD